MTPSEAVRGFSAVDLSSMRLLLSGESVIDWPRLEFSGAEEVDRFIALQEFDRRIPAHTTQMQLLMREALGYLTDVLRYRVPEEIKRATDPSTLILFASQHQGLKRNRIYACMMLKVMHILHHLLARELLFNAPLSEAQLSSMLNRKVFDAIDKMRAAGIPVVEYTGGRKTRHSLVTKLLAKRETIASQIFDKTRFRIVVKSPEDLFATIRFMTQHLFPFNYVIPGQSENVLLDLAAIANGDGFDKRARRMLLGNSARSPQAANEFSGKTYRSINFVVDMPLRVQDVKLDQPLDPILGDIIFVLAEFQLLDAQTAERNEEGENNHAKYKARQEQRVRARLESGLKK
jgi:uncharacterized protein (TIGR04552 family)